KLRVKRRVANGAGLLSVAAALEKQRVAPDALQHRDALAAAYLAKATTPVQLNARNVLRKDRRLQRPNSVSFRFRDQFIQQSAPNSPPSHTLSDVHRQLRHSSINLTLRY